MEWIRPFLVFSDVLDGGMKDIGLRKDFRHKAIRVFLTGVVQGYSLYGLYLRHIKGESKYQEGHPLGDITGFRPVPNLFGGEEAYYISGTDVVLVVEKGEHKFLRISYNLDEDYLSLVTLEHLLEEMPEDVAEVIIFNLHRLDK